MITSHRREHKIRISTIQIQLFRQKQSENKSGYGVTLNRVAGSFAKQASIFGMIDDVQRRDFGVE